MSLFGSLYTAVSGLNAQSQSLSMISDNIANSSTIGYKSDSAQFSDLVTQSGASTQFSSGGVATNTIQNIDLQGLTQQTQSSTDMAIVGKGFFVVQPTPGAAQTASYTRAGSFTENSQGYGVYFPSGQLAIDPSNNIYGPADCSIELSCFYGSVWQLQSQQGSWTLNELYHFNGNNGYQPVALLRDSSGDFFGTTFGDGGHDSAAVYELTPSNGGYNYTQLYSYGGVGDASTAALVMDAAGNLYGADSEFGFGYIFKLTRSGNNWTFSTLHSFSGPDGEGATGTLVFDSAGNLYGTTVRGGAYGYGVIWEITP